MYNLTYENKVRLHEELKLIIPVIYSAKLYWQYADGIEFPETPAQNKFVKESIAFQIFRVSLWESCCIELHKLFKFRDDEGTLVSVQRRKHNKVEVTNYFWLLDDMKSGVYGEELSNANELQIWNTKLQQHRDALMSLSFYRDKVYAHSEKFFFDEKPTLLRFDQLHSLIILGISIIDHIYDKILYWSPKHSEFLNDPVELRKILEVLSSHMNNN